MLRPHVRRRDSSWTGHLPTVRCRPIAGTQETAGSQATPTIGKTRVTGCLEKGDEAREFSITGK